MSSLIEVNGYRDKPANTIYTPNNPINNPLRGIENIDILALYIIRILIIIDIMATNPAILIAGISLNNANEYVPKISSEGRMNNNTDNTDNNDKLNKATNILRLAKIINGAMPLSINNVISPNIAPIIRIILELF
jgi:hypothetical protein